MQPISGVYSGGVQPVAAKPQHCEEEPQESPSRRIEDKYIPTEKQESPGCYRLGKDENGKPKLYAEECTCNTDRVDREIVQLKKEQEELKRQIRSETDEAKIRELEKRLEQVESQLSQKDNDTYRRQNAVYS